MVDPAAKIRRLSHALMVFCGLGILVAALIYRRLRPFATPALAASPTPAAA